MDTLCRTCLCESLEMKSLTTEDLLNKYQSLSSLTINFEEDLTTSICPTCVNMLDGYYKFRQKCIENDKYLRENKEYENEILFIQPECEIENQNIENFPIDTLEDPFFKIDDKTSDPLEITLDLQKSKGTHSVDALHELTKFRKKQCAVCGKYVKKSYLKTHLKMHEEMSKILDRKCEDDEFYKCDICDFATKKKEEAISHSRGCFVKVNCPICNNRVRTDYLNQHIKRNHHENDTLSCEKCDFTTCSWVEIGRHRRDHATKLMCPYCKLEMEIGLMKSHVNTHLTEEEQTEGYINCHRCIFKAKTYKDLFKHDNIHRPKKNCEYCGKLVRCNVMRSHIKTHTLEEVIAGEKYFLCKYCIFKTKDEQKAIKHKESHRVKVVCNVCGSSVNQYNLKNHLRLHKGHTINCEVCLKDVKPNLFTYHKYSHINEEKICEICGKTLYNKLTFVRHMKVHKAKAKKNTVDDKITRGKSYLEHVNTDDKERPFCCQYCSKRFSTERVLTIHIRQHTDERPYHCTFCPMAFRQNISLKKHALSKHKVILPKQSRFSAKQKSIDKS